MKEKENEEGSNEKLIASVLEINPNYTRDLVERAIKSCSNAQVNFEVVSERTKQFYLTAFMDKKIK